MQVCPKREVEEDLSTDDCLWSCPIALLLRKAGRPSCLTKDEAREGSQRTSPSCRSYCENPKRREIWLVAKSPPNTSAILESTAIKNELIGLQSQGGWMLPSRTKRD